MIGGVIHGRDCVWVLVGVSDGRDCVWLLGGVIDDRRSHSWQRLCMGASRSQ